MSDPYTMEARLCDDAGMVSDTPIDPKPPLAEDGLTYLGLLNRWVGRTRAIRGDRHEPITEPFACTGSAHLIGEHIRCTSPAHTQAVAAQPLDALRYPMGGRLLVVGQPVNGWQVLTAG